MKRQITFLMVLAGFAAAILAVHFAAINALRKSRSAPPQTVGQSDFSEKHKTDAMRRFAQLARAGKLGELTDRRCTFNLMLPAVDNRLLWYDMAIACEWRYQTSTVGDICRIVDPDGQCRAWGSHKQLEELLFDRPTSVAANYRDNGYSFSFHPGFGKHRGTVVLIHGLARRIVDMRFFAESFARHGYDVYGYDYPTSERGLREHSNLFLAKLRGLLATLPADEPISVVTHSMGALVLRGALAEMSVPECQRLRRVVMLAPPNQGSDWATIAEFLCIDLLLPPLADLSTASNSWVKNLPPPAWIPEIGIVRAKYDFEVSPINVELKDAPFKLVDVSCGHDALTKSETAFEQSLHFLRTGDFFQEARPAGN